jgi:2-polyprenyl-6-methoxyphenol hydroxylase-like FAD-dependent oxidoreductase
MSTSKNAVIVGGSLGGLLTGVVLKRLGHKVTIFERSPTPLLQDQGAGIVAGGDTLHYLKQFDRIQKDVAVISPVRHYLNIKGEEINREEWEQKMTRYVSDLDCEVIMVVGI